MKKSPLKYEIPYLCQLNDGTNRLACLTNGSNAARSLACTIGGMTDGQNCTRAMEPRSSETKKYAMSGLWHIHPQILRDTPVHKEL